MNVKLSAKVHFGIVSLLLTSTLYPFFLQNPAVAGDLPDWALAKPVLKRLPGYGTFVCAPAPDERYYAKSKSDPAIPDVVRRRIRCPKGTALMSTVPALRTGDEVFGKGYGASFVCIPAVEPEAFHPKFDKPTQPTSITPEIYAKMPKDCPYGYQEVIFGREYDPSKVNKGHPPLPPELQKKTLHVRPSSSQRSSRAGTYFYSPVYLKSPPASFLGQSGAFSQVQPEFSSTDVPGHSIAQIVVASGGTVAGNSVELGWTVDKGINGDTLPRLFIYRAIKGKLGVYNLIASGFVPTPGSLYKVGMPVQINSVGFVYTYKILHNDSLKRWELFYRDTMFGYYPDSLWTSASTTFTRGTDAPSWFGEINTPIAAGTCTDMGNGIFGGATGAALISNPFIILNNSTNQYITATDIIVGSPTNPLFYKLGKLNTSGGLGKYTISFGGPGKGKCT